MSAAHRSSEVINRLAAALLPLLVAGCSLAAPSPTPSPTPSAEGFYLRAWLEQALPPEHTFGWLPMLTISEDVLIDGVVAVPAIFPGPLTVMPHARAISVAGQTQLIDQARQLGLLTGASDFSGGQQMPGSQSARLELVVDGVTYTLTGDPNTAAAPTPGTPAGFAFFWQRLATTGEWLAGELGPLTTYSPERVAIVFVEPQPQPDVQPNRVAWPLDASFADIGVPWALEGTRCATFEGDDLDRLLPVLTNATQIDVFADAADEERSLIVRPLVPGEPSPCEDS
jgi:hypothetical protein